ncbi:MAG: hypothetical protein ACM3ML_23765 [Micromonosporaceae bacterium]
MRIYEPAEFLSQLASNQLEEPPLNLTIYGPVKADENDGSVLLFSMSASCDQWMRIPVSLISSIQHGGSVSCKDHRHPFVRVVLTEPSKEDVSAVLFMRLFAEEKAKAAAARTKALAESGDCDTFTFDDVPYACCPPPSGSGPWDCKILL